MSIFDKLFNKAANAAKESVKSAVSNAENKKEELEQNILLEKSKEIVTLNEKEILEYYKNKM